MKAKRLNYKTVLKKLNDVQIGIYRQDEPGIIMVEKLSDGSFKVINTTKNYKRIEFTLKGQKEFDKYLESIKNFDCTIIIDDFIEQLTDEVTKQITKNCTDEELKFIIEDENHNTYKTDEIIIKNIKKIIGDDNNGTI